MLCFGVVLLPSSFFQFEAALCSTWDVSSQPGIEATHTLHWKVKYGLPDCWEVPGAVLLTVV